MQSTNWWRPRSKKGTALPRLDHVRAQNRTADSSSKCSRTTAESLVRRGGCGLPTGLGSLAKVVGEGGEANDVKCEALGL